MSCSLQKKTSPLHVLPLQHSGRFSMAADNWWLTLSVLFSPNLLHFHILDFDNINKY